MEYTKSEKAYINKEMRRFHEAEVLYKSFVIKYNKGKKLKQTHLKKNKMGRYIGEVIFIDMVNSYPYTNEEKALLIKCLISMPAKVLYNFEQLYIKSSMRKFEYLLKETEKHIEDLYENKSTNKFAYNLYKEKFFLEDKSDYMTAELKKRDRKLGLYTPLFIEIDNLIDSKPQLKQNEAVLQVMNKHITNGDNTHLNDKCKKYGTYSVKVFDSFFAAYRKYKSRRID